MSRFAPLSTSSSSCYLLVLSVLTFTPFAFTADPRPDTSRGDRMIAEYFRQETARLSATSLADVRTKEDWLAKREEYRRQLLEMLGLDPWPEKTDLQATVTGRVDKEEFHVENVHFQSRPGLYVTGNLYVPKEVNEKLPAILYVCGHATVKKDGVSLGGKAHYQHHGAWFARNGYVCLTIDTLQLGEIEGIHHGTYKYDMWWWLNRGYTSAGVEAWNCVRAVDYLQSRPEVDPARIGVTGRSGGGAYSWWIAAIDERIRCAVPVAGITDLQNHVVDGCVEGHCDCMYMVNTYRWDYPQVAALVAPRPLLISNTDSDGIFPLDGVVRVFEKTRRIYGLLGAKDQVALNITAGGHHDTQELQVHAFRWFNQHLKKDKSLIETAAVPLVEPAQLQVFPKLPADERNTKIQETFVAAAAPVAVPSAAADWQRQRDAWRDILTEKVFRGWPQEAESLDVREAFVAKRDGITLRAFDFTSQGPIRLRVYLVHDSGLAKPELTVLNALDARGWKEFLATLRPAFSEALKEESLPDADEPSYRSLKSMLSSQKWAMAYVAPRGVGPTAWDPTPKKQVQHQRRFYLLGQTLDGMQVWDIRRAVQAIRTQDPFAKQPLWLQGERQMAGNVLYASLFEPDLARVDLHDLPRSHRDGPYYLNVQRFLDLPAAVAMAADRCQVKLYQSDDQGWEWPQELARKLEWKANRLEVRRSVALSGD